MAVLYELLSGASAPSSPRARIESVENAASERQPA
jgi:hypothetical protein